MPIGFIGIPHTIPLPDVLVKMLKGIEPKDGTVFDATNLRKAWQKACRLPASENWRRLKEG
jgi:hypothetical protein